MSRHGYHEDGDCDTWASIRWSGAVKSALRGKRGQALLRRLRKALDAMPDKRLIAEDIVTQDGSCCALGAIALAEGLDVEELDPEDAPSVARVFNVAESLAREIVYVNDEYVRPTNGRWVDGYYRHNETGQTVGRYSPKARFEEKDQWTFVPPKWEPASADDEARNQRLRWDVVSSWVDRNLVVEAGHE